MKEGYQHADFPARIDRINSEFVRCDPVLDLAANRAVELGNDVGVQIAASGLVYFTSRNSPG